MSKSKLTITFKLENENGLLREAHRELEFGFSKEAADDLRSMHGLGDVESDLVDILTTEVELALSTDAESKLGKTLRVMEFPRGSLIRSMVRELIAKK